ncbi:MAG: DNA-binding response regulator, partial [Rhodoferax sp.]|nr:DNA-binding response regulator [Rhodoferax sp.]
MRLLLIEDDTMIGEAVLDALRAAHYAVDWVREGSALMTDG